MRDVLPRRTALLGGLGLLATAVTGCSGAPSGPITLATGPATGVYRRLGDALARVWGDELGRTTTVVGSEGSVGNVAMLAQGRADVAFCAADVAVDAVARLPLAAIARVHDDAIHVVVAADSSIRRLADLRGRRVSVGAPNSGVLVIAPRLLATVGLGERDLDAVPWGLGESTEALRRGAIEAFFWSGGVPTGGVEALAAARPIRLLDLGEQIDALRRAYPAYDATTVPARTYGLVDPVTTASVRNVLLVRSTADAGTMEGLTTVLLERRAALAEADPAGRSIDPRSAVGTQPIPLHPGAVAAYRRLKGVGGG